MYERVGVPGFLRGQRGVAITGAPRYFNFYEVDDFATLTSKAYLDRLNDPTPWPRRLAPHMHNNSRTLCRVSASFGAAVPAFWTMVLVSPAAGGDERLRTWLARRALPELLDRPGVLGAHLIEGERTTSGTDTAEKRLRSDGNEFVDWVILVGGYDDEALARVGATVLAQRSLATQGAAASRVRRIYRFVHCVSKADLSTL